MAEEKSDIVRGVIVEFDFTVLDGAQILFDMAKNLLAEEGVELTVKREALHLAGGNYQGGIAELYRALGVSKEASKTARTLANTFAAALTEKVPTAMTPGFKAFVKALADKGLKVVLATRADVEVLKAALDGFDPAMVVPYAEQSMTYGNCKWDAWNRALSANGLVNVLTVGVTGSGYGVKAALVAGMSALAVVHDHVAYQDFGGADAVTDALDAKFADEVFRMLHLA